MIAVIIPAHNEEEHLGACLDSLNLAARCGNLLGEPVELIVVLDSCTDGSRAIANAKGARILDVRARNVGVARAFGADLGLRLGARWLSFTDADTRVDPRWLSTQLSLGADAVCGTVAVRDWGDYPAAAQQRYASCYTDADNHRHIHGANLGLTARAYRQAGGFMPLASSEDVALVEELERHGIPISWSSAPRVYTSPRRTHRAPEGFGAYLMRIEADVVSAQACSAA